MTKATRMVGVNVEIGLSYWKYWKYLENQNLWIRILQEYTNRTVSFDNRCKILNWYIPVDVFREHIADFDTYGIDQAPENPEKYICRFRINVKTEEYDLFGLENPDNLIPILRDLQEDNTVEIRTKIIGSSDCSEWEERWYQSWAAAKMVETKLQAASIKTDILCFDGKKQWSVLFKPNSDKQKEIAKQIIGEAKEFEIKN